MIAKEYLDQIAQVCHEANRAYCATLGDHSQKSWAEAPEWQRSSARMGVDLHMMGDFGPEASHVAWMRNKISEGWVHGLVKDEVAKTHPCIIPFDGLSKEQQHKDVLFRAIVHSFKGETRKDN